MSEKMAEEGGASTSAGSSRIVRLKDNFVKITKNHRKTIFVVSKGLELFFSFIAAAIEGYKSFVSHGMQNQIPQYKDIARANDTYFRIICTALDGFIIFNLLLLISFLQGEQIPKKLLCIFSFIGAIFCLAAGIIMIEDNGDVNNVLNRHGSIELIVSGSFAILAALTFALESIITYLYSQ